MNQWIVISQSKAHPERVFAHTHNETNECTVYDRIEDAREVRARIERVWPHMRAFVFAIETQPEWLSQALNEGDGTYKP